MSNWHREKAIRTNIELAYIPAHVVDYNQYGFFALCGERVPQITVDAEHAHKKHNNTCRKCLSLLVKK